MSRRPVKRQRERRDKPEKRQRLPVRASRAQVHYLEPDPDRPHRVKLYLSPTRAHMRATIRFIEGSWKACQRTMGMVCSRDGKVNPRLVVARMFLNAIDLRRNGMEIMSHECTHAGMAWARLQRANLQRMAGEEVLCYAVGRMTRQVNRICYIAGVWR